MTLEEAASDIDPLQRLGAYLVDAWISEEFLEYNKILIKNKSSCSKTL